MEFMSAGSLTDILDHFNEIKMTEAQIAAVCLSVSYNQMFELISSSISQSTNQSINR